MLAIEMADICARFLASGASEQSGMDDPWFVRDDEATTGRDDQFCVAVWMDWHWGKLQATLMKRHYLLPAARLLVNELPVGCSLDGGDMHVPRGVDHAAYANYGGVGVRVVVMDYAVPLRHKAKRLARTRVKPYYNTDTDRMERRAVLPLLRIDVRVQQKELTS